VRLAAGAMAHSAATQSAIDAELRSLNEALSFGAVTSGLAHKADAYAKRALPASARLSQYSQLQTLGNRGLAARAAEPLVNVLGKTLVSRADAAAGVRLEVDPATGAPFLDAEMRRLARAGVIVSAGEAQRVAKEKATRDVVGVYLSMRETPDFQSTVRESYKFTPEMRADLAHYDKAHSKGFIRDAHSEYMAKATLYGAWPPQSGVPPWPVFKSTAKPKA